MRQSFVVTGTGRVRVTRFGSGAPIVLLPTNGHSWHEFHALVDHFPDNELIIWDTPGQGDSDPTPPGISIDGYTELLIEVMDQLGVEEAPIVGCSIGAFIAACAAVRYPDRVSGVGLVELQFRELGFWESEQMWSLVERMFSVPSQTMEQVEPRFVRPIDAAHLERWNIDRNKAGTRALLDVMWAIRSFDVAPIVGDITQPVRAIFGSEGPTVASTENAQEWLPKHAQIDVVKDAGHFIAFDQPGELASLIKELAGAAGTP